MLIYKRPGQRVLINNDGFMQARLRPYPFMHASKYVDALLQQEHSLVAHSTMYAIGMDIRL